MLYDISQDVGPEAAVFPGDTPFSSHKVMSLATGGSCDVSTVTTSVHVGTHADAPAHFQLGAAGIGAVPLAAYLGPARVVSVETSGEISAEVLDLLPLAGVSRLLLRTLSACDRSTFNLDFAHLTVQAELALGRRGLLLVGIDTPSVDHPLSKSLAAHRALLAGGIAILENLVLTDVPDGDYELIALPLRWRGLDASPVRAVLRTIEPSPEALDSTG